MILSIVSGAHFSFNLSFLAYPRFSAYKKWKFEILNISKSEGGGIKVDLKVWTL